MIDLETLTNILQQILAIGGAALVGGVVTSALTEALKIDAIKVPASRFPKTTAAILSLLFSVAAVYSIQPVDFSNTIGVLVLTGATLFCAVKSYDLVLKALYQKVGKL